MSGHTKKSAMTFTERNKALALTGLTGGQEGKNIGEKGMPDTGVRGRGREQRGVKSNKELQCSHGNWHQLLNHNGPRTD